MPKVPSVTVTNQRTIELLEQIGEAWRGEMPTRVIDRLAEREIARMSEPATAVATAAPDRE